MTGSFFFGGGEVDLQTLPLYRSTDFNQQSATKGR